MQENLVWKREQDKESQVKVVENERKKWFSERINCNFEVKARIIWYYSSFSAITRNLHKLNNGD